MSQLIGCLAEGDAFKCKNIEVLNKNESFQHEQDHETEKVLLKFSFILDCDSGLRKNSRFNSEFWAG